MKLFLIVFQCLLLAVGGSSPPVIDISSLYVSYHDPAFSYEAILRTASLIDHVLQKYGVFVAVGHNLTSDLLEANQRAMHELFQLPLQDKEAVSLTATQAFGRGYLGFGTESGLLSEYFEPKEGFSYGYPDNELDQPPNLLQSRNFWPSSLSDESKNTLQEVYKQKVTVARLILFALSKYFNMRSSFPKDYLETITNRGHEISLMRLFHYFNVQDPIVQAKIQEFDSLAPMEGNAQKKKSLQIIGSSPHTDWGLLTLILQDNIGGLEFLHEGEWVGVQPTAGGIVVNGGDYLRMISNYRYHSPIHRVLSPDSSVKDCHDKQEDSQEQCVLDNSSSSSDQTSSLQERYSMVFFYYPNYDSTLVSGGREYKFHDHTSGTATTASGASGKKDGGLNYNTLEFTGAVKDSQRFDDDSSSVSDETVKKAADEVMFGDYIIKKWRGVTRSY